MMKIFKDEVVPLDSATWEKAYEEDTSKFIVPDHCPEMVDITDATCDSAFNDEPEALIVPDPLSLDDDDDFLPGEGNDLDLTPQVRILAANLLKGIFCPLIVWYSVLLIVEQNYCLI